MEIGSRAIPMDRPRRKEHGEYLKAAALPVLRNAARGERRGSEGKRGAAEGECPASGWRRERPSSRSALQRPTGIGGFALRRVSCL